MKATPPMKKVNRRNFITAGLTASVGLPVVTLLSEKVFAEGKKAAAAPAAAAAMGPEVDPAKLLPATNPLVVALKYTDDVSKATLRTAARAGVEAKDQFCDNCQLYKAGAGVLKGTKEALGICQMIPGGFVKAKGWCNSWVKKA